MLCSKLHCMKGFNLILFSYKIAPGNGGFPSWDGYKVFLGFVLGPLSTGQPSVPASLHVPAQYNSRSNSRLCSQSLVVEFDLTKPHKPLMGIAPRNPLYRPVEPGLSVRHPQPSTLNPRPSTLNPQSSTFNTQHSTLNTQHSTLNPEPRTSKPEPSTLNPDP